MHVELIGSTSSGKTTLTGAMEVAGRRRGLDVVNADDLVLALAGLRRVRGEFLRRRLVDLLALPICLRAFGRHRELGAFALRLNLARNALRKIGIFEVVRRRRSGPRRARRQRGDPSGGPLRRSTPHG